MILKGNKLLENTRRIWIQKGLLLLLFAAITSNSLYSQYQKNVEVSNKNFHDHNGKCM